MTYYKECHNCGNTREGDKVYFCEKCKRTFCRNCREVQCKGPLWLFEDTRCPFCGTIKPKILGEIG